MILSMSILIQTHEEIFNTRLNDKLKKRKLLSSFNSSVQGFSPISCTLSPTDLTNMTVSI